MPVLEFDQEEYGDDEELPLYLHDLFDYFKPLGHGLLSIFLYDHFVSPWDQKGKRLPEGAKSLFYFDNIPKVTRPHWDPQDKNLYHCVSPMQREGVDWLCDIYPKVTLTKDRAQLSSRTAGDIILLQNV